jgi:hypothetical protein
LWDHLQGFGRRPSRLGERQQAAAEHSECGNRLNKATPRKPSGHGLGLLQVLSTHGKRHAKCPKFLEIYSFQLAELLIISVVLACKLGVFSTTLKMC